MSYITEQEALDNVTEFASQTASDKARLTEIRVWQIAMPFFIWSMTWD